MKKVSAATAARIQVTGLARADPSEEKMPASRPPLPAAASESAASFSSPAPLAPAAAARFSESLPAWSRFPAREATLAVIVAGTRSA